jgi:large subunit ribosomal protein L19e
MSLKSQRRLAAKILKVGESRVWIDPERASDVEIAITREEIRKLIHEGVIKSIPKKGISRARARELKEKKKKGRRKGHGTREGASHAKVSKKEAWMKKVRAMRKRLKVLKEERIITENVYRMVYRKIHGGVFDSIADMERYIKAQGLWKKK